MCTETYHYTNNRLLQSSVNNAYTFRWTFLISLVFCFPVDQQCVCGNSADFSDWKIIQVLSYNFIWVLSWTAVSKTQRNTFEQTLLLLTQCRPCVRTELGVQSKTRKTGGGKEKKGLGHGKQWEEREKNDGDTVEREGERNPGRGIKVERRIEGGEGGREQQRGWRLGWMELSGDWVNIFGRGNEVSELWLQRGWKRKREGEQHVFLIF